MQAPGPGPGPGRHSIRAMPSTSVRLAARAAAGVALALTGSVVVAPPAAAHAVGGGELPVPTWLLGYGGVALVGLTALALRIAPRRRAEGPPAAPLGPAAGPLRWLGLLTYAAVLFAAFTGPDTAAANIVPTGVLVVFWVGLPLLCLVAGDVFARVNPFDPVVAVLERALPGERTGPGTPQAPPWTGAAFLALFTWFLLAYHRPGSPRALGVLLILYAVLAVAGGLRWGRPWLRTGEGFGALSAGIAWLRSPRRPVPPGIVAVAVVWLGSTAFDALGVTRFWVDLLGSARGWERTALDTMGFVWVLAIVGGVAMAAARLLDDGAGPRSTVVPAPLGAALLAVAATWFVVHDLTLLLFEGQNFLALLSDPLGQGRNLFGTIDRTIDFTIVQSSWVLWTHVVALLAGHALAVLVAHRAATAGGMRPRRVAMVTWVAAGLAALGVVLATLLVLD
jgi:hypothetical protein